MDVKIYQIYWKQEQKRWIGPPAEPYWNENGGKFYEYGVFQKVWRWQEDMSWPGPTDGYVGYLSWSATKKTSVSIQQFVDWIKSNPGYECYGLNPKRYLPMFNNFKVNLWQQGQRYHPRLLEIAQDLFNKARYSIDLTEEKCDANSLLTCNYWVGNSQFWDDYMGFCEPVSKQMEQYADISGAEHNVFFAPYPKGYYPYVMERMWTTFVTNYNRKVKILHA